MFSSEDTLSSVFSGGDTLPSMFSQVDIKPYLIVFLSQDIDYSLVNSLDSLTHESQISELSVKQLKIILQKNCINYKGCVEKHELLERVVRLWQAKEEEKVKTATYALMGDIGQFFHAI